MTASAGEFRFTPAALCSTNPQRGYAMGNSTERERRHQANLARINTVQSVVGRGDALRIDHVGTLLERARLLEDELGSHLATERGLAAFDRLLAQLEERGRAPQAPHLADVLLAVWNRNPLPLGALRALDRTTGDDVLAVLDAYRYGRLELTLHVEGGARRVARVLRAWQSARA
jgi:hypothetical protein